MTFLDFFIDARIRALDGWLSGSEQSVLLELIFWVAVYIVFANVFSRVLRSKLSKMDFWHQGTKMGVFCWNAQDDIILLVILGCHHLTAGLLCLLGVWYNDADLWRHGYLFEVGFELADLLSMLFRLYPFRHENMKPDSQFGLVFHHLPGIIFGCMILDAELHHNEHVREIAFWLLIGAAASCWGASLLYLLCLDTQMPQATSVYYLNVVFFVYCRAYVFPKESYLVMQDIKADPKLAESWLGFYLPVFFWLLTVFNVLILADIVPKGVRYTQRLFDGVTVIEKGEVPFSREDRERQQKRHSFLISMDDVTRENVSAETACKKNS